MIKIHLALFIVFLILAATVRVLIHEAPTLPKNTPLKFEATINSEPRIYDTYQLIYVADSRIYVDLYPRYKVGDRIRVEGQLDQQGRMFDPIIKKLGYRSSLTSFRYQLRERISQKISELLPSRQATLVVGTVLGLDTISKEFRDELIKTGTIHVVVVSGQNLMIVAGIFLSLARHIGKRQSLILAIIAVFAYAFLTGFEPPVIRASIMVLAASAAIFAGREVNTIVSLIFAALIIILIWPQSLFEISFQLTFAATLGIVTLGRKIAGTLDNTDRGPVTTFPPASAPQPFLTLSNSQQVSRSKKGGVRAVGIPSSRATPHSSFVSGVKFSLVQNVAIATSAYLFTAPIIFFYFSQVSLVAPFVNILVAEAVFPIMILGFLIAAATFLFMPLAQLLAYFAFVPALYFSEVVRIFGKFF